MDYLAHLTRNKPLHEFMNPDGQKSGFWSPEMIAIAVFAVGYIGLRLTESYVIPMIPEWMRTEAMAFYRWAPILVPVAYGLTYLKPGKKNKDPIWEKTFKRKGVSADMKRRIGARQGWRCIQCQQPLPAAFETDHRVPKSQGGSNDPSNLQAMCPNCHGEKTLNERMNLWKQ